MIAKEHHAERRERLRPLIHDQGLSGLLVSLAANRWYLSGFELHDAQCNESTGMLLIGADGRDKLMTDPRYVDAAKRVWPEEDIFVYTGKGLDAMGVYLAGLLGAEPLGVESEAICLQTFQALDKHLTLKPTEGLVETLRVIKDGDELAAMERSCKLNHAVFEAVATLLHPGMTEVELAWEIEKLFREKGASELAFQTIVGVGPNAALPHARPGNAKIHDNELVLVDAGARLDAYNSDQTRTFWVGSELTPQAKRFYQTMEQVREAQDAAIAAIRPGVKTADVYAVARDTLARHKAAEHFTHGLGHGVGLEVHEAPRLTPTSTETLRPGMVVTVEPGLYYPEWGGIRWEYMVVVTEDGARVL